MPGYRESYCRHPPRKARHPKRTIGWIVSGFGETGRIGSHPVRIEDALKAYEKFDLRIEGCAKVLIRFEESEG